MKLSLGDQWLLGWVGVMSGWALLAFAYDKWRAGRRDGRRVAESTLCLISALGGWPGAFLAMLLFRHKSAKASFQLKFVGAFFVWAGLFAGGLKLTGRL